MKIYLAGADHATDATMMSKMRVPNRLCSYYYVGTGGKSWEQVLEASQDGSDWIMDSGLFSMMFGSDKGKLTTLDDYRRYAEGYLEFVTKWKWKHAIVECDVQRVLGVEECEILRDEFFRSSSFDVIYVWHLPETVEGLKKLVARSKRVALSVPELRYKLTGSGELDDRTRVTGASAVIKKALVSLLKTCRDYGPDARIHLLGNTSDTLLRLPADSSDSTSWAAPKRWHTNGTGRMFEHGRISGHSVYSPRYQRFVGWVEQQVPEVFEYLRATITNDTTYFSARCAAASAFAYMMLAETLGGGWPEEVAA